MFKERSFCSCLLFTPFCLKNVVRACLNLYSIVFCVFCFGSALVYFSPLCSKEGSWRLSKSLLYFFLCMLVPLSSPFLLYVIRKVLGVCQNRLLVPLSSHFHSFLFEKRSCRLSQSLLYCLFSLSAGSALVSVSPLISTNILGACQNRLLFPLWYPYHSFLLEERSWRLSDTLLYCNYLLSRLLFSPLPSMERSLLYCNYLLSRLLFSPLSSMERSLRLSQSAKIVLAD
jgi:hypothetical protein